MPRARPTRVTIRSYQVGFGDCFLMSFAYRGQRRDRHALIDFGTTGLPQHRARKSMLAIADDIATACNGKLDVVVATHRHADHISGFAGRSGAVIAGLNPSVVIQPWTEDPNARRNARRPTRVSQRGRQRIAALDEMNEIARHACDEIKNHPRRFSSSLRSDLGFLGEDNIKNAAAVRNLMRMSNRRIYAHYGSRVAVARELPGVTVRVLGPPTLDQSEAIERQRHRDPDEFWHLQARAGRASSARGRILFPDAATGRLPFATRWLKNRLDRTHGEELLEIVRSLDDAMNNTSLILLFEMGRRKLLFSGDAQIENWSHVLNTARNRRSMQRKLAASDFYKVGHHGSLNATPKTLWHLFDKKRSDGAAAPMKTALSTRPGKHGSTRRRTEVPRRTLKSALDTDTELVNTEDFPNDRFFEDIVIDAR